MGHRKVKDYDDNELVLALAAGDRTYAQIARDFALSRTMVAAIARGEKRPMLYERIQAATTSFREQGCRLAARMVAPAIGRLVQLISPASDASAEVQRKAACDILSFAFGNGARLKPRVGLGVYGWDVPPGSMLSGLSLELRDRVLLELGAPAGADGAADEDGEIE